MIGSLTACTIFTLPKMRRHGVARTVHPGFCSAIANRYSQVIVSGLRIAYIEHLQLWNNDAYMVK